jgi:hypothetical protein
LLKFDGALQALEVATQQKARFTPILKPHLNVHGLAEKFLKKILHGKNALLISASLSPENERASFFASR